MIKLPSSISEFFAKLHASEIDLSKAGLQKMFARNARAIDALHDETGEAQPKKMPFTLPKSIGLDIRLQEAGKYFSGAIFEKAMITLDKSTLLIIGISWLVAIVAMSLAFVSVKETSQLKLKVEVARALDPVLPKIVRLPLNKDQYEPLLARLKKQFPNVLLSITDKPGLRIQAKDADEFMSWLNAISYTDSMVSTIRWTISAFCVGSECPGEAVMQAELSAEAINITQPDTMAQ